MNDIEQMDQDQNNDKILNKKISKCFEITSRSIYKSDKNTNN